MEGLNLGGRSPLRRTYAWHPDLVGGGEPTLASVPFQIHGRDPKKHFRRAVTQGNIEVVAALIDGGTVTNVREALQSPSFDGSELDKGMRDFLITKMTASCKSAVDE